MSRFLV
ncbi:hypothetical protein D043_2046A, partial [Vibrio parahaemolyticus EKP-021]